MLSTDIIKVKNNYLCINELSCYFWVIMNCIGDTRNFKAEDFE